MKSFRRPVSRSIARSATSLMIAALCWLSLLDGRVARADVPAEDEASGWTQGELARHLSLEWSAPAECPGEPVLRERIRSLLRARGEPRRRLRARATVTAGDVGYSLRLVLDDGAARSVSSETCVGLVEATALILAVDIEGHLGEPRHEPARPTKSAAPAAQVDAATQARLRPAFGFRVVLDAGTLPRVTSGYRASFLVGYDLWRAETAVTAFIPRDAEGPRRGTGARVDLVTGGLRLCRSWLLGSRGGPELRTCLGAEVGRLAVAGFGITQPSTSAGPWTSAVAGVEVPFAWNPRLPVIFGLDVGAALARYQAVVRGIGPVFDPDPWLIRATVGLELDFFRHGG